MAELLISCVSAIVGGTVVMIAELVRDGIAARRADRIRHDAEEAAHVRHLEEHLQALRDEVAGLSGLVVGAGIVQGRRRTDTLPERP